MFIGKAPLFIILFPFIILAVVWSLYWKGKALWKAAHQDDIPWFIAILIINTLGILDILYLYVFSERKSEGK